MNAIFLVQNSYEGVCEGYTNTYEQAYAVIERIMRDRLDWDEEDIQLEMDAVNEGCGEFFYIEETHEIT